MGALRRACRACCPCCARSWSIDELQAMATQLAPAVASYWRFFSLCQLGLYFSHRTDPVQALVCATGELESADVWQGALCVRMRTFWVAAVPR